MSILDALSRFTGVSSSRDDAKKRKRNIKNRVPQAISVLRRRFIAFFSKIYMQWPKRTRLSVKAVKRQRRLWDEPKRQIN